MADRDDMLDLCYDEDVRETDDAILIKLSYKKVWLPKSQIEERGDLWIGIPRWLAEEKEIEGYCEEDPA